MCGWTGHIQGNLALRVCEAERPSARFSAKFCPQGDIRGKEFLTCAAGRNGFPLKRGAFATRWIRSGGAFCCRGRLLQPRRKIVKGMLTTCENYDMLFTQFRRARLTAFHCGSLAWLQLCLSADPCIYTPGGDTTSAGGFLRADFPQRRPAAVDKPRRVCYVYCSKGWSRGPVWTWCKVQLFQKKG